MVIEQVLATTANPKSVNPITASGFCLFATKNGRTWRLSADPAKGRFAKAEARTWIGENSPQWLTEYRSAYV